MPLTERDRRTLIIGGVVLGVMLVGFFLFNLVSGGGEPEAVPGFASPNIAAPLPSASATPTVTPSVPPIQNFTGRDPFSLPPALQSGAGTSSPTVSPTGSPSSTFSPTVSPTATPTAPGNGSSTVVNGRTVVLLDTFVRNGRQMAQTEVDGTIYNVAVGDTFAAGAFELRSVSGNCATYLNGDESFTLCATAPK